MDQESFEISFSTHPAGLRAWVRGEGTLDNTLAYWQAIVAEVAERRSRALLLIDELRGDPLSEAQWRQLVEMIRGGVLDQVRIAHVKPLGLQMIEYCELFAIEAGMKARVFSNEAEAALWLRHGLS